MPERARLLKALETMPDEAFLYFVLASRAHAMTGMAPALAQIWPDGLGGFTGASRVAITEMRAAAAVYLEDAQR